MINICVIDIGISNVSSMVVALEYMGLTPVILKESSKISTFDKIIFPGVGNFDKGKELLSQGNWESELRKAYDNGSHILGICLGMQLFAKSSEESCDSFKTGLHFVDAGVKSLEAGAHKIPHTGFSSLILEEKETILLRGIKNPTFYYNHGYGILRETLSLDGVTGLAITNHNIDFYSIIEKNHLFGVQFHPELSHSNGLILLKNFIDYN